MADLLITSHAWLQTKKVKKAVLSTTARVRSKAKEKEKEKEKKEAEKASTGALKLFWSSRPYCLHT